MFNIESQISRSNRPKTPQDKIKANPMTYDFEILKITTTSTTINTMTKTRGSREVTMVLTMMDFGEIKSNGYKEGQLSRAWPSLEWCNNAHGGAHPRQQEETSNVAATEVEESQVKNDVVDSQTEREPRLPQIRSSPLGPTLDPSLAMQRSSIQGSFIFNIYRCNEP